MATTFDEAATKPVAPERAAGSTVVEPHWRSIAKAVSWRAVGTIDTIVISFLVTGKVKFALSIGFVELFTKIVLFYLHERAWHRIPYGRVPDRVE
jgi:uncharacterized membrane protein